MIPKNQMVAFPKPGKMKSAKKLIISLDRIFSKFIRLRDSDYRGICWCVTCGRQFPWQECDAGHFVQRDRMATRFDEKNVNVQCQRCNRFRTGEQWKHGEYIDRRYGKGTAELLRKLGSARGAKLDIGFLEYNIEEYKRKIKKILQTNKV